MPIEVEGCPDPEHCDMEDIVRQKTEECGRIVGFIAICLYCRKHGTVQRTTEGFSVKLCSMTLAELAETVPTLFMRLFDNHQD